MRFSITAVLYSAQLAAAAITTCVRNDCLRAIVASAIPDRHGSADCSSFFVKTVTPAPTTVTKTAITTVTAVYAIPPVKKRDVVPNPSSIPAYASACSGAAGYSSACSCIGVTPTTTTVATPTTTTTISRTTTLTQCADPLPTFVLQIEHSGVVINGVPIDGTFGQLDGGDGPIIGFNGAPESQAVILSLNARGNLLMDQIGIIGYTDVGQQLELMHFDTPANLAMSGSDAIASVCSVAGGVLKCADDGCQIDYRGEISCQSGDSVLQICPGCGATNDLWIGQRVGGPVCTAVVCVAPTFKVVPVCTPPK